MRRFAPEPFRAAAGIRGSEPSSLRAAAFRGLSAVLPSVGSGGRSEGIPADPGGVVHERAVRRDAGGDRVLRVRDGAEQLHPVRGGEAAAEQWVGVRLGESEVVSAEVGAARRDEEAGGE